VLRSSLIVVALVSGIVYAQQTVDSRTSFEVRYVTEGAVYLNGGREDGLQEGFRLSVRRLKPGQPLLAAQTLGQIVVTAVTAHSAVCTIQPGASEVQVGDSAQISREDMEVLESLHQSKTVRHYAQVVSFTEGDPLDQELRDYVPKPPSPEVNRVRGRIAYEFGALRNDTTPATLQNGMVVRVDANRLGGTYWNFTGFWRGRMSSRTRSSAQPLTIHDLLNRTYHIGMFYNNPQSKYSIGVGRLYVPWATSLSTIDGGYFGRRVLRRLTVGAFGGSTPDPTAWDYKPNRQIGGTFANVDVGTFETVRISETVGLAISRLSWKAEREYAFTETNISWGQKFSIYHNLQADRLTAGRLGNTENGPVLSRSFLTARVQPVRWLAVDFNHNYFRTIPTFDLLLIGTGALDQFLFDGLSAGLRVELPRNLSVYGSVGQSKRSDDTRGSINQMYGISMRNVLGSGFRGDVRRSIFHGAFANGWYQSVSAGRDLSDRLRIDVTVGDQEFHSALSNSVRGMFVNSNVDWFFTSHYVIGGGINLLRGRTQSYDQTYFSLGYVF
jgi:hypothetical protein